MGQNLTYTTVALLPVLTTSSSTSPSISSEDDVIRKELLIPGAGVGLGVSVPPTPSIPVCPGDLQCFSVTFIEEVSLL